MTVPETTNANSNASLLTLIAQYLSQIKAPKTLAALKKELKVETDKVNSSTVVVTRNSNDKLIITSDRTICHSPNNL